MSDDKYMILKNVRVSFPHLFKKPMINGAEGKCGATLMLDKRANVKEIKAIAARIASMIQTELKLKNLPADKKCLRDGDESGREEYEGVYTLSANSKALPTVIANDGESTVTSEENCAIYGGCYVNAKVSFWAQNNKYGKRINATLVAIQFMADGEALDGSYIPVAEAMDGFGAVAGADPLDFDLDLDEDDELAVA